MITALNIIAERKIEEYIRNNRWPDLSHWKNRPLPKDDMSHVPPDLRMAYRLLKNAGYVPEEVALQREIVQTEDLLARCTDEREKVRQLKKLNFLQFKLECRMGRSLRLDSESPYFDRVVEKVSVSRETAKNSRDTDNPG